MQCVFPLHLVLVLAALTGVYRAAKAHFHLSSDTLRRHSRRALYFVFVATLGYATAAYAGSASAAKSRIMQAQDYADRGQKDDALAKLTEAEGFLDGLSDDEKAPIEKTITDMRAKLGASSNSSGGNGGGGSASSGAASNRASGASGGAGGSGAATSAMDPEVAGRVQRNIERYLSFAEGDADSSPHSAGTEVDQAADALNADDAQKNLTPEVRAKLQARIDALRAKLNAGNMSDEARRFTDRVQNNLRAANENDNDSRFARARLDQATELLASDEAKQKLDAATIQKLQDALVQAEANLAAANKQAALNRAAPAMQGLEEKVATDPYKGVEPISAYQVTEDVQALRARVVTELRTLPDNDADRKAYEQRLSAAQEKMDAYDANFAAANAEIAVVNQWTYLSQSFAGWDQESYAPTAQAFEKPVLTKTEQAAQQSKLFLAEKPTIAARANQSNMPKATAAIADADKTMADAQAKLDGAFNQWMDAAEKSPRPQGPDRFSITSAADMGRWADDRLADTKYHDADVARAKKLDQRWQDELAAIKQQHEAALKQMTADANAAWPAIESSISAENDFHPADVSSLRGKTFRFKHIRNRSGWDFDGRFDLVMWVDGQPVAGMYAPKIRKAFADAAQQIGDGVDDHIDWDVIATIEGSGIANQRYTTEVKDEHMNLLGKIEGARPVPCIVIRVIAVHAGPVASSAE